MTRWAIVADLERCVGCQTCTAACKQVNATAPGVQWRKVVDFEAGEFPNVARAFVPVGCMHCDDPPCLDVCPSTATRKRDDGIVTIDYDVCIGCSYCAIACPYQARFRVDTPNEAYGTHHAMNHEVIREHWDRRAVAQKCTFCVQRINPGLAAGKVPGIDPEATPACVNSCIAGALHFGDADDPDSNISELLRDSRHTRMHAELGTGPGIYYLLGRGEPDNAPAEPGEMVAEPAGLAAVSPKLQTSWDARAAANFILGGTGTGLFAAAVLAAWPGPAIWPALLVGLVFVGLGLTSVWLEIGRPWRFLNVFRHPQRSWMTREAFAALPLFGLGGLAWLTDSLALGALAAACGLVFLYCQARIVQAARGIPAWRQPEIVPLIVSTGLVEGTGLYAVFAVLAGHEPPLLRLLSASMLALVIVRYALWRRYRAALGVAGAPTAAFRALDGGVPGFSAAAQLVIVAGLVTGYFYAPALAISGALALATGWAFKFSLITRAAFDQGYAIDRMPVRGGGESRRGIKPGWRVA